MLLNISPFRANDSVPIRNHLDKRLGNPFEEQTRFEFVNSPLLLDLYPHIGYHDNTNICNSDFVFVFVLKSELGK